MMFYMKIFIFWIYIVNLLICKMSWKQDDYIYGIFKLIVYIVIGCFGLGF